MENSMNEQATTVENRARFFKRKVLSLYDSLVRLDASLSEVKLATFNSSELAVRLELLERAQASFDLAQNALEEIDYNEIGSETRDNFDERFLEVKSRVRAHFDSRERQLIRSSTLRRDETIDPSANGLGARSNRRRLPELKLPTFGGGYTEYASFWSMFESVIDKDNDLDDVEKFQHLLSCLTGPALDAVRSLEISRPNYRVALEILDNRFNNNRLVFQSHIKDLLGTKKVEAGASVATKLREFSDKVNVHMGALKTLGRPEEIANSILIYVLLQKLDVETQAAWEDSRALDNPAADKVPTANEFFTFLDERCRKLETLQYAMGSHTAGSQVGRSFSHNGSRKAKDTKLDPAHLALAVTVVGGIILCYILRHRNEPRQLMRLPLYSLKRPPLLLVNVFVLMLHSWVLLVFCLRVVLGRSFIVVLCWILVRKST
ncbi:uncharacterized protein LOC127565942 [Drosophila albomicans]|uniref:Uncharacterized protein LOC127565942 n=1 Tax=Drosophila albomicans TaxID=7291 RepID=A0A9C6T0B8_DROAB|nr:uncharacterized protein LOC127565942 [Drosophila albomicans]